MKKDILRTILDEDLKSFLESICQLRPIEDGEVFCIMCERQITLANLQMIIPGENGRFDFVCNDPKCIEQFSSKSAKG